MINPTQKSPERAVALQKYLLLHSQHDALQKHLNAITSSLPTRPTFSPSPSASPDRYSSRHSSLSSSPTTPEDSYPARRSYRSSSIQLPHPPSFSPNRPPITKRRSSLPTVIDESILTEIEEEEGKLKDVNQQIKSTLTDLLNCESVRGDKRYKMWVQTRLMDTERELEGGKEQGEEL